MYINNYFAIKKKRLILKENGEANLILTKESQINLKTQTLKKTNLQSI